MSEPFRTKTEPKPARQGEGSNPPVQSVTKVEVPYRDYETEHGQPYTVDYFDLGRHWNEGMGGYEKEVSIIEGYIKEQIDSGELANSQKAVKAKLKKMEKLIGVKDEARAVVKVALITEHIKFLNREKGIRENFAKYGNQ